VERVSSAALSWIFHGRRHTRVVQPSGATNNSPLFWCNAKRGKPATNNRDLSSAALSWIFRHTRVVQPSGVTNNSPLHWCSAKPASQRSEVRYQQRRRQARATLPLRLNGSHLQAASNPQMCGTRATSSSSFFPVNIMAQCTLYGTGRESRSRRESCRPTLHVCTRRCRAAASSD